MRFDLSTNTLTAYAVAKGKLSVWGGDQKRPQIHIQDVTDFIADLLTVSEEQIAGQVFNAAGHNLTVREIAEIIKEEMHGALELTNAPARSDERSYHVSSEKIVRQLGFNMKKTVRDAVVEIIRAHDEGLWKNPDNPLYHNLQAMQAMGCAVL